MPQASALDASSLVPPIAPTTPLMPLPMPPPTMADAASPQTQIAMVLTNRSMLALPALPLRYFYQIDHRGRMRATSISGEFDCVALVLSLGTSTLHRAPSREGRLEEALYLIKHRARGEVAEALAAWLREVAVVGPVLEATRAPVCVHTALGDSRGDLARAPRAKE